MGPGGGAPEGRRVLASKPRSGRVLAWRAAARRSDGGVVVARWCSSRGPLLPMAELREAVVLERSAYDPTAELLEAVVLERRA